MASSSGSHFQVLFFTLDGNNLHPDGLYTMRLLYTYRRIVYMAEDCVQCVGCIQAVLLYTTVGNCWKYLIGRILQVIVGNRW